MKTSNYELAPINLLQCAFSTTLNFFKPFILTKTPRSKTTLPEYSGEFVVTLHNGTMFTLEYDVDTNRWWQHTMYYGEGSMVGKGGCEFPSVKSWFVALNPNAIWHCTQLLNMLANHDTVVAYRMQQKGRHIHHIC